MNTVREVREVAVPQRPRSAWWEWPCAVGWVLIVLPLWLAATVRDGFLIGETEEHDQDSE